MDQDFKDPNEPTKPETPDDVSTLYSWANLHGSKYRDFSAARREHRSQVRQGMTEDPQPPARNAPMPYGSLGDQGPGAGGSGERPGIPAGEERYAPYSSPPPQGPSPSVVYVREYGGQGYSSPIPPIATPASVPYVPPPNPEPAPYYASAPYSQPPNESQAQHAPVRETPAPARQSWSFTETQSHTAAPASIPASTAIPMGTERNPPLHDTLQQSRERVASRWYALKGVFGEQPQVQPEQPQSFQAQYARIPLLAVFSLAGGVGKTSLAATLGRALSHYGERALIVDTGSYGLLPFYFGSREGRTGQVRTFSPPGGTPDAPIHLVSLEMEGGARPDALTEEISRASEGMQRVVVDIPTGSVEVARQALRLATAVLVPILPDMNSVVSLGLIDRFLRQFAGADGRAPQATFVLTQFDSSLPLHLDVREVLRQQLGDRLLPTTVRRSPAVSEALAEGMTVIDYAPTAPVTEDYLNIASWLRTSSAPASAAFRGTRWSER
jgi:cellulose biosynthesis protein BcsQ